MRCCRLIILVCIALTAGGAAAAYREHFLRTRDIVARESWPHELVRLIETSAERGDRVSGIDVRRVGFITSYAWRMPASEDRLRLHLEQFRLSAAPPEGVEYQRIASQFPRAWTLPTADFDVYANPVGLPGADNGDFEYVLLHDNGSATLYFYYYFNF